MGEPKTFEASPPTPITERVSNMISEKMSGSTTENTAERDLAPRQDTDSSLASEAKSTLSSAAENARETVQEISEDAQRAAEEARQRVMDSREAVEIVTTINDMGTPAYGLSTEDGSHTASEVAEIRALETAAML